VRTSDFDYELPPDLIAQHAAPRGTSRLLVLDRSSGEVEHRTVRDLPRYLRRDDLVLLNDTRVISARVFATRPTGRRFELLLLRAVDHDRWEALLRPSSRAREGELLVFPDGGEIVAEKRIDEGRWMVRCDPPLDIERLDQIGETPLPPYIRRDAGPDREDRDRYQTVYAAEHGAVAAPTAGLHFDQELLADVERAVGEVARLTLHVGLGTFRPVAVEEVTDHRMHEEWCRFSEATAAVVNRARAAGRRIVCVGTTTVRALEGALATRGDRLTAGEFWTDIFITPGFEFRGVGAMVTNFHLPRSTLLMLVAAFAGSERVLAAYAEAVEEGYRFYSYGDAMLII
jgi:S-adenosylmethionine:tRNA ribosyltransferase-isomerase